MHSHAKINNDGMHSDAQSVSDYAKVIIDDLATTSTKRSSSSRHQQPAAVHGNTEDVRDGHVHLAK